MLLVGIFVSFFIDPLFLLIFKDAAVLESTKYVVIRALSKLALMPIIMGIGYELIKLHVVR